MKIDEAMVDKIAALARLRFNDEERADFTEKFKNIIKFVEQLSEVDTSGVESIHVHERDENVLGEDIITPSFSLEQALDNAPDKDDQYYLVPKVLSGGGDDK